MGHGDLSPPFLADALSLFPFGVGRVRLCPSHRFVPTKFLDILKLLTPIRVKGANSTVNCPFFHSLFSDFYQMTLESFDDDGLHHNFNELLKKKINYKMLF